MNYKAFPKKQGLYDRSFEKDSCGVGFIANMTGRKTHKIIQNGLEILKKLEHRGACGADALSGDGAGILIQMPHTFFKKECQKLEVPLPAEGHYGAGLVFLPQEDKHRERCLEILEKVIANEGLPLLGWRDVPVDNTMIGEMARGAQPVIRQIFIGGRERFTDPLNFERSLYCIRKQAYLRINEGGLNEDEQFYICSLSSRTFIYKGQLTSDQVETFYPDVKDEDMVTALALVHSRYSTNTFPSWSRAQPLRFIAHNGEINTVRGNKNWIRAREGVFQSSFFDDVNKILPVIEPHGSDSADFDMALEMLYMSGRSLAHSMMMMIPEPWTHHQTMTDEKKAFYEYHASIMEPWDGPASIAFTNGEIIGAVLDRNGLRPSRYIVTKDKMVIMASEVGVLPISEDSIEYKGRLQPGKMFLVDLLEGRIIKDEEIKDKICTRNPYSQWLRKNQINVDDLPEPNHLPEPKTVTFQQRRIAFGYDVEDEKVVLAPMISDGVEATGSMGNDTPLAALSEKPQLLFNYFKQLFAQVTNPAIDSIREMLVMSTEMTMGAERNLLSESPEHCRKLKVSDPLLTAIQFEKIKLLDRPDFRTRVLDITFNVLDGEDGLEKRIESLCQETSKAIEEGATILILSDKAIDTNRAAIPSLLATSAVHHHLLRELTRTQVGITVETGEAREIMHFALLIGYGATAVYPYMAYETIARMIEEGIYVSGIDYEAGVRNFISATQKGLFKIIAKMGISTLRSYRGAQIFEAVGLNATVIDRFFTGTPSRISGIGLEAIARETLTQHRKAYTLSDHASSLLDPGGKYHWRRGQEKHMIEPKTVAMLQHAVRSGDYELYKQFSKVSDEINTKQCALRGMMKIKNGNSIPIEEVESVEEITRRFCTGAMSIGSISREAHETLAIAMNRLGGRSNTGEGGEDPIRYTPDTNGDSRRSKIKQVASGRFGVTSHYLTNADELQIKIAQGAKPGEGGQLPGHKVSEYIAKIRNSTPGVGLISPPPHHDIYSIEDLQQLIYDLHCANPTADVSVKLVSEVGVGTIAAGVSKAHSDGVLISGHDGGTGASPQTSIKHAGLPWELGLAETQQVLVMNDLRGRIRVQVDGQFKTGRDVVIGGLLGADEFGFSTFPLIALGCIMMRKCHLNTCSVGIATQDPLLREKFSGKADYVVNLFQFIGQEVREIMAEMGVHQFNDLIGRSELLEMEDALTHYKTKGLDFSNILYKPNVPDNVAIRNITRQDHTNISQMLDHKLIRESEEAIKHKLKVNLISPISNTDRAVGATLSYHISKRYGNDGLTDNTIHIKFKGSAGQSFGAFLAPGVFFELEGDANDYLGKGLSGGHISVYPPKETTFAAEENIIGGNVILYGATKGKLFMRGVAGERFAVRNSGAQAVVEGVGDHACEYMTGGIVVVLGPVGRNFAAGMSGGIAFVLNDGHFEVNCNQGLVDLLPIEDNQDVITLKIMIEEHTQYTGSAIARKILDNWDQTLSKFVKVYPRDYRRVLEERRQRDQKALTEEAS